MASLRDRNRRLAMQATQRTALPLFYEQGFDSVTVETIAQEVEIAASTVYRHFKTKEAIVLWDEHDPAIEAALVANFASMPPLAALEQAFVVELGGRYAEDLEFQLNRVRFIYATESLHAAAVEADLRNRQDLTKGLRQLLPRKHRDAAALLAGTALLALDLAMDQWQQRNGRRSLGKLIEQEFHRLAELSELGK